jgi:hypothetical protein
MAKARAHPVISVKVVGDSSPARAVLITDPRIERIDGDNGELMITLKDPLLHHSFLVELLVARNIQLHSVAPHQLKLEDVFLRLTKGIVQ